MGGNCENGMGIYSPYTVKTAFLGRSLCVCRGKRKNSCMCQKHRDCMRCAHHCLYYIDVSQYILVLIG